MFLFYGRQILPRAEQCSLFFLYGHCSVSIMPILLEMNRLFFFSLLLKGICYSMIFCPLMFEYQNDAFKLTHDNTLKIYNKNSYHCSVYFNIKYFKENIFTFYSVCFAIKYLVKNKLFSINQINLDKFV